MIIAGISIVYTENKVTDVTNTQDLVLYNVLETNTMRLPFQVSVGTSGFEH
jgi:hypothetical protein